MFTERYPLQTRGARPQASSIVQTPENTPKQTKPVLCLQASSQKRTYMVVTPGCDSDNNPFNKGTALRTVCCVRCMQCCPIVWSVQPESGPTICMSSSVVCGCDQGLTGPHDLKAKPLKTGILGGAEPSQNFPGMTFWVGLQLAVF